MVDPLVLSRGNVYAESEPLLAKVAATYELLAQVAGDEGAALSPAALRLGDDPVQRAWLDDYLRAKHRPTGAAFRPAPAGAPAGQLLATTRPGVRLFADSNPEDAWSQAFRALFADVLVSTGHDIATVTPSAEEALAIDSGLCLLRDAMPALADATVAHSSVVAVVDGADAFESATDRRVPRAVFVARSSLSDPVRTAEALLHESVHQKLYDLQLVFSLYVAGYDARTAPTVSPVWHAGSADWSIDRAFAAAHVYAHLTCLLDYLALDPGLTARYAGLPDRAAVARFRGDWLLQALVPFQFTQFNRHGQAMHAWLCSAISEPAAQPAMGGHA